MNPQNIQLKQGTGLVIYGPQGSGKTTLARAIAIRHGSYQQIEAGLGFDFHLRDALNGKVKTLIIDIEFAPKQEELVQIKAMLTQPTTVLRLPNSNATDIVPSPHIILCANDLQWLAKDARRFEVIDLRVKALQ